MTPFLKLTWDALVKVRLNGGEPKSFSVNPRDWSAEKEPTAYGDVLWGLPVLVDSRLPVGEVRINDFAHDSTLTG